MYPPSPSQSPHPRPRPTTPAPNAKSYPAPPQISASVSLPLPEFTQQQHQAHNEAAYIAQHAAHQAAVAQSTLGRLRKLNLRNYAAPAGYAAVSPRLEGAAANATSKLNSTVNASFGADASAHPQRALSTSSTSSVESIDSLDSVSTADSTPLQTPTPDDDEEGVDSTDGGNLKKKNAYVHQGLRHDLDVDVLGGPGLGGAGAQEEEEDQIIGNPSATSYDTDDTATPIPSGARWGPGMGAKEFAAAVGATAGVFKLHLGGGRNESSGSSGSSRATTPIPNPTQAKLQLQGQGTSASNSNTPIGTPAINPTPNPNPGATRALYIERRPVPALPAGMRMDVDSEVGTSPPFSAMKEMANARGGSRMALPTTMMLENGSPDTELLTPLWAPSTSPPPPLPAHGARHGHDVYWPWGSFVSATEKVDVGGKDAQMQNSGADASASESTSSPPTFTSTQIAPPHRRRTSHTTGSPTGSASSSGSDSAGRRRRGSSNTAGSLSALPPQSHSMWGGVRPGSPRPGSPRPHGAAVGGGALRLSPVESFGTPTSAGGQDDAVYQAFVREWCFAQAPVGLESSHGVGLT